MRSEWLDYFADAVSFGSIRAAADAHHISPQGLSKAVKSLEAELGVPLFERGANSVSLTPQGAELLANIEKARTANRKLLERAGELRCGKRDMPLLVLCSTFVFLCDMIAPLQESIRHLARPATCMQVQTKTMLETLSAEPTGIYEGKVLCGFPLIFDTVRERSENALAKIELRGYKRVPLLRYRDGVLLSAEHPLAGRHALCKADIMGFPVISSSAEQLSALVVYLGATHVSSAVTDMNTRLEILQDAQSIILTPPFASVAQDPRYHFVPLEDGYGVNLDFVYDATYLSSEDIGPLLDDMALLYRGFERLGMCTVLYPPPQAATPPVP